MCAVVDSVGVDGVVVAVMMITCAHMGKTRDISLGYDGHFFLESS